MMVFIANFVQKYKPKQLMNNKTLIVGACLAVVGSLNAQTKDGGISLQMLQQIQQNGKQTTAERAIANAIATNSIDELHVRHKVAPTLTRILAWKRPNKTFTTKRVRVDAGCLQA